MIDVNGFKCPIGSSSCPRDSHEPDELLLSVRRKNRQVNHDNSPRRIAYYTDFDSIYQNGLAGGFPWRTLDGDSTKLVLDEHMMDLAQRLVLASLTALGI